MANGVVVVDRLNDIRGSLLRAIEGIQDELARRNEYEDYEETYVSHLRDVSNDARLLEDKIRTTI